jgi:hypothetical protein
MYTGRICTEAKQKFVGRNIDCVFATHPHVRKGVAGDHGRVVPLEEHEAEAVGEGELVDAPLEVQAPGHRLRVRGHQLLGQGLRFRGVGEGVGG